MYKRLEKEVIAPALAFLVFTALPFLLGMGLGMWLFGSC